MRPIKRLLVANRSEIAIRVMRAASELKIQTIAIYTHEDRYSMHRYKADESYQIGNNDEPLKPYLNIEEIVRLAKEKNIDAIHPGYGFLSENVEFVKACQREGIIFIGPPVAAMDALGDKVAAKKIAQRCGVPMIEDSKQNITSIEIAHEEAQRIGYPIMLKAVAGGGGRGMRVVRTKEELPKLLTEARNEAANAFGNDTMFIEKFVDNPKHIEVQLLGDQHGNLVHLFERDCSLQRRYQKVIEIAPSVNLKLETRQKLYDYAIKIGKEVAYSNAGTVEFLVDTDENIFFIEVNPRIQVEHTITEEITGIDLVRSQILIAEGLRLDDPKIHIQSQKEIKINGFAVQCRITTEDPENNFKPDFGTLAHYRNAGGYGIRLDEGSTYTGKKISPYFDSLLVKVTSHADTFQLAIEKSIRALTEFKIRGVKTNIPFLLNVLQHEEFKAGKVTVPFIATHPEVMKIKPQGDRSTKNLYYIADIIVNGHADIGKIEKQNFVQPIVPQYNPALPFPIGNKNRLSEMGRDQFLTWVKNQKQILYTDTTFRDAHQSLAATRFRTYDFLKVASAFAQQHPQLFSMEVWGGATFDVSMRFLHECPWKRLQALRKAMPNMLLQMLIRGSNAVGYSAYPDNLIEKFIEQSSENGIDVFRIFDSLNWIEAMKVSIKAVREKTGGIAEAAICYTGDVLTNKKYNLQYYVDMAKQLEDAGAHILAIKDMSGLLKPLAAEKLIPALSKAVSLPIHLHTHDTSSIQSTTYLKAIDAGVHIVDVALASVSGLTSQPNFNSFAEMMKNHPRENPINMNSLNAHSRYWDAVRKYYFPFEADMKSGTAEVYQHEIPGGQYTNLVQQAQALGVADKFEVLVENYSTANKMFGDIVKVTPSSKVVGDMAIFMTSNKLTEQDIFEKGATLSFPESVKGFFKGDLGQPTGGFPKELQKIILKNEKPYTERPNAHLKPVDFTVELEQFLQQFPKANGILDYLSYKMYPKVFEDFFNSKSLFGDLSILPTPLFYYGLKANEEVVLTIAEGKTIIIRYLNTSKPDDKGICIVSFELNGQLRNIKIKDHKIKVEFKANAKASKQEDIGSPLQGKLSRILVTEKQKIKKGDPLFVIEAMKMESIVEAPFNGTISKVILVAGNVVEQNDWVIEMATEKK